MEQSSSTLTPVQQRGNYYFKRDDLYRPYPFSPMNGSKLRQCQLLVEKNIEKAQKGIITGTSVLSPQAAIVATIAKAHNVPCKIMYGGTTNELLLKKKYPVVCLSLGADVEVVSKMAYTSVLTARAEEYAKQNDMLLIRYGFDLMNNLDVFLGSVANQVQNLPQVDNLVVTIGSSITILGILMGIAKYHVKIGKIYGIGCAPNRMEKIRTYADAIKEQEGVTLPLDRLHYIDAFNEIKGYKYEQTMKEEYMGIKFHPRYEAKTFHWLRNHNLEGSTLMWITGKDFELKAKT